MLSRTYDAFIDAGASDEKARAAAEELAAYEAKFGGIKQELTQLRGDIDRQFVDIRGKLTLVQGMLGLVIAACLSILFKVFA